MKRYDDLGQVNSKIISQFIEVEDRLKNKLEIIDRQIIITEGALSSEQINLGDNIINALQSNLKFLYESKSDISNYYEYMQSLYAQLKKIMNEIVEVKHDRKNNSYISGEKILEIQEEERKRVSRELHDSTVQSLAGLIYKMEVCDKLLSSDVTRVHLEIQIMVASIKMTIEEMRNIIYDLRPALAEQYDVCKFLNECIEKISLNNSSIHIEKSIRGKNRKLKKIAYDTLTRVLGEALKNIVRHANASQAEIIINFNSNKMKVSIKDNGVGFDKDLVMNNNRNCFGLSIMNERITLLGGNFEISSIINKGTNIFIEVSNVYSEDVR